MHLYLGLGNLRFNQFRRTRVQSIPEDEGAYKGGGMLSLK